MNIARSRKICARGVFSIWTEIMSGLESWLCLLNEFEAKQPMGQEWNACLNRLGSLV